MNYTVHNIPTVKHHHIDLLGGGGENFFFYRLFTSFITSQTNKQDICPVIKRICFYKKHTVFNINVQQFVVTKCLVGIILMVS
jgi:hypothetical protein